MLRFLLKPRWIGLLLLVVVLGITCVKLSQWQFHRYAERKASNTLVRDNLAAPIVPVSRLMSTHAEPSSEVEWRRVQATGHYDSAHQIALLYRTRGPSPGVDVLTPFITGSGAAVLIDRGWIPATGSGNVTPKMPSPASGTVTIRGWVRVDSTGGSNETEPSQGSVRSVSAAVIGKGLPYPVYRGFLQLTHESPASPHAPSRSGAPSLGGGPSFFYGWQWLFFALLFFAFWLYFAYAEYRDTSAAKRAPPVGGGAAPAPPGTGPPGTSQPVPASRDDR